MIIISHNRFAAALQARGDTDGPGRQHKELQPGGWVQFEAEEWRYRVAESVKYCAHCNFSVYVTVDTSSTHAGRSRRYYAYAATSTHDSRARAGPAVSYVLLRAQHGWRLLALPAQWGAELQKEDVGGHTVVQSY